MDENKHDIIRPYVKKSKLDRLLNLEKKNYAKLPKRQEPRALTATEELDFLIDKRLEELDQS